MNTKRYKYMDREEFIAVAERRWVPVNLVGSARPVWMRGIPEQRVQFVLASGAFIDPRIVEVNGITYSGVVGGIDVYRYDEKDVDRGYPFNKDHYIVAQNPSKDESLLVAGPIKDDEHWLAELPELDPGIEILEFNGAIMDIDDD
jgi:hypothetical protein